MTTSLPPGVQYVWACASIAAFVGGLVWIICIFWPYLKWSKAMMIKTYDLSHNTAASMTELQKKLTPALDKLEKTVAKASEIVEGPEVKNAIRLLEDIYKKGDLERILKTLHDKILPGAETPKYDSKEEMLAAMRQASPAEAVVPDKAALRWLGYTLCCPSCKGRFRAGELRPSSGPADIWGKCPLCKQDHADYQIESKES